MGALELLFSQNFAISLGIALIAMLGHAVKKWTTGELRGRLVDWYLVNPRASIGALLGCVTGVITLVLSGGVTDLAAASEIVALAGVGFAADTFNSQTVKNDPRRGADK